MYSTAFLDVPPLDAASGSVALPGSKSISNRVLLLAGLVESALPPPSLWPVAFGLGMGLTLLFAFGLPPVLQLAQVPPLRVIRRDVGNLKASSLLVLAAGAGGFVGFTGRQGGRCLRLRPARP